MNDDAPGEKMATLNLDEIKAMIPHREPFLMIDEVTDVVPDASAVGIKNVNGDEPYFAGHFPGHPIMPGVLIIEAMAQTAAVLVMATTEDASDSLVYFMSVDQARFRRPVFPGDRLCLHVEKQKSRGSVWKFRGEARVDDELKAEAVYSAMIVERT